MVKIELRYDSQNIEIKSEPFVLQPEEHGAVWDIVGETYFPVLVPWGSNPGEQILGCPKCPGRNILKEKFRLGHAGSVRFTAPHLTGWVDDPDHPDPVNWQDEALWRICIIACDVLKSTDEDVVALREEEILPCQKSHLLEVPE